MTWWHTFGSDPLDPSSSWRLNRGLPSGAEVLLIFFILTGTQGLGSSITSLLVSSRDFWYAASGDGDSSARPDPCIFGFRVSLALCFPVSLWDSGKWDFVFASGVTLAWLPFASNFPGSPLRYEVIESLHWSGLEKMKWTNYNGTTWLRTPESYCWRHKIEWMKGLKCEGPLWKCEGPLWMEVWEGR